MCHSLTWHFVNMVSTGFEEQVLSVAEPLAPTMAPDGQDEGDADEYCLNQTLAAHSECLPVYTCMHV